MPVKEIVRYDFPVISPKASLAELIRTFLIHRQDILPVVNENSELKGIITLEDLIHIFMPHYFDLLKDYAFVEDFGSLEAAFLSQPEIPFLEEEKLVLAADLMNTKFFNITEDVSILKAASLMNTYKVAYLPVLDLNNKWKGVLTYRDLLLYLFRGQAEKKIAGAIHESPRRF
ncbi:MAG: CBS domain-containing protein [Elusimicrobiota bacterium]